MVAYEIEFRDKEYAPEWDRYRSEKLKPFLVKKDAEEFVASAKLYHGGIPIEFRIIEVPLPWGRQ